VHDLNNLMTVVMGYSDLLLTAFGEDEEVVMRLAGKVREVLDH